MRTTFSKSLPVLLFSERWPWADSEVEFLVQLVEISAHQVVHLHILQVMPTALVPRVQVGGVSRQGLQPYPPPRARHELLDLHPSMDRRAVPDHQQPLPG